MFSVQFTIRAKEVRHSAAYLCIAVKLVMTGVTGSRIAFRSLPASSVFPCETSLPTLERVIAGQLLIEFDDEALIGAVAITDGSTANLRRSL